MEGQHAFDFDVWLALARSDPDRFEQARREAIQQLISNSGNDMTQQRLKLLNKQIDSLRKTGSDPEYVLNGLLSMVNNQLESNLKALFRRLKMTMEDKPA